MHRNFDTSNLLINMFSERMVQIVAALPKHAIGDTEAKGLDMGDVIKALRMESAKDEYQQPATAFLFEVSTAHLSPAAHEWLKECAEANRIATVMNNEMRGGKIGTVGQTLYGYFMHAPNGYEDGDIGSMPQELANICIEARKRGAAYILFDRDVEPMERLPTWGDDGKREILSGTKATRVIMDDVEDGGLADELDDDPERPYDVPKADWARMGHSSVTDVLKVNDGLPTSPEGNLPFHGVTKGPEWPLDIAYLGKIDSSYLRANIDYAMIKGTTVLSVEGIKKLLLLTNTDHALINVIVTRIANNAKTTFYMRRRMASGLNFTNAGDRPADKLGHAIIGRTDLMAIQKAGADLITFMRDTVPPDDPQMAAATALEDLLAKIANA